MLGLIPFSARRNAVTHTNRIAGRSLREWGSNVQTATPPTHLNFSISEIFGTIIKYYARLVS